MVLPCSNKQVKQLAPVGAFTSPAFLSLKRGGNSILPCADWQLRFSPAKWKTRHNGCASVRRVRSYSTVLDSYFVRGAARETVMFRVIL